MNYQTLKAKFRSYWPVLKRIVAPTYSSASWQEKLIAMCGGFIAILAVVFSTHWLQPETTWIMVASIGASTVLLFAAPHAPMSQPWPVIGSHLIAATVGISMSYLFTDPLFMAASAVGLSIALMYQLGCFHPPGGATSLIAVMAHLSNVEIGYEFVLFPVLSNLIVLILVAILFNNLSSKRRYPAYFAHKAPIPQQKNDKYTLSRTDLSNALKEMGSYVDISKEELEKILALSHFFENDIQTHSLQIGDCYSNGSQSRWSVLEIVEIDYDISDAIRWLHLKHRAGFPPEQSKVSLDQFLQWAAYPVKPAEAGGWQRISNQIIE